ncbi:helix-turn-helix domain-containing protein [Paenibacillus puerhi]|uniref:helix-turn-helix domain-containing protein n=1 Tax=Paenibacillus puerhi TaxID=2692622 RepID=UPI001357B32D|nr:hypothetical protein [Paenibacillus puerhi]
MMNAWWRIRKRRSKSDYVSSSFMKTLTDDWSSPRLIDFLVFLRMEYAKKMFRETEVTVGGVSEHVGYTNTTSFKKIVGMSPGQYRESQAKNEERRLAVDNDK